MRRNKGLIPLLVVLVAAFGGLAAALVTDSSPELGLDLQGGVSVVLAPTGEVDDDRLDEAVDIIRTRVDALGVAEPEIARQGDAIVVQLPGVRNRDRALDLVGQTAELRFRPVLQQAPVAAAEAAAEGGEGSGTTDTTAPDDTATDDTATTDTTAAEGADATATTGTTAPAEGGGEDEGALGLAPGESAAATGPAAPVAAQQETPGTTAPADPTATTAPADPTATTAPADPEAQLPIDPGTGLPIDPAAPPTGGLPEVTPREDDAADATVVLDDKDGEVRYQLGPTLATGRVVETASATLVNGAWQISLTMRGGEDGIDLFNDIAAQCVSGQQTCPTGSLSIVLDSVVQSAPQIQQANFQRDQISITGDFTESEAKDLALVLRYGSLPVELERQTVQTVSASLGEDSLRAGVVAGVVGVALVILYMIAYYRALGVVVLVGLTVWGALQYAVISWLGATQGLALTLSGVTGIIVSIGVTVDSYVVFFERLKDEVRAGRTLRSSTERAFARAFRTIVAADVASFIGAAILWWLTVGSVRGFAFFLGLSTVLDVVVAWFFTRPVVTWLSRSRVFTEMPVLGVARGLAAAPSRRGRATAPTAAVTGAGR